MDRRRTLIVLFILNILLNLADNYTTWYCLSMPYQDTYIPYESNPLGAWLFRTMGLVNGLAFDSLFSAVLMYWFIRSTTVPGFFTPRAKATVLIISNLLLVWAVVNNTYIISVL